MIIISQLLDGYYRMRLHSSGYRRKAFIHAMNGELRHSKTGRILIRNMNYIMGRKPVLHDEFVSLLNGKDYQEAFWTSDLGYGWFQGNFGISNAYFELAKKEIIDNKHTSLLDVGCGWGEFCKQCSAIECLETITGIDISDKIIDEAMKKSRTPKITYLHKTIFEITGRYDIITMFGSPDYIPPSEFMKVLRKALELCNKEMIILNSLRGIPFETALNLTVAKEIKRYDSGFVEPLNQMLGQLKESHQFDFKVIKYSRDSQIALISK